VKREKKNGTRQRTT